MTPEQEIAVGRMLATIDALKGQLAESDRAYEAIYAKYDSCPHTATCACSHDEPTDVCALHAPQLAKAQARIAELEVEATQMQEVIQVHVNGTSERMKRLGEVEEKLAIALQNYAIRDADAKRLQAQVDQMALEMQQQAITAKAEGRRKALEEACRAVCVGCRGNVIRDGNYHYEAKTDLEYPCTAKEVRALLELPKLEEK